MSNESGHFALLVIRPEVEVQSALALLGLIEPDEVQPRHSIRFRSNLELVCRGVDHDPTKGVGPPLPQAPRIDRVDDYLLPLQSHRANLDRPQPSGTGIFVAVRSRSGEVMARSVQSR